MKKALLIVLAIALVPFSAFAVDGVVLINDATVKAMGGYPLVISNPGSYRLSGNLTVPNENTTAIFMNNDNINLDLNGFSILGPTVCVGFPVTSCSPKGTGNGVDFGARRNITVVNGTIRGMGHHGIAADAGGSSGGHVERIHADSNGTDGIRIAYGTVSGSTAVGNGANGISTDHSTISGNTVAGNNTDGIFGSLSTVSGNTVTFSNTGIFLVCPSSIVGNTATDSSSNLITSGSGCSVANNAAP